MGRLESQVGTKLGFKREVFGSPETKRKWMHYWEPLGVDIFMNFGGYLEGKMEPSWHQIGVQQRENMEKGVSNEPTFSLGKNHNRQGCAC